MNSIPMGVFLFLGLPSLLLIITGVVIIFRESVLVSEFRHQRYQPAPARHEVSGDVAKLMGVTLILTGIIFLLFAAYLNSLAI